MALVATAFGWLRIPAFLPVFAMLGGALALSGCVQSTASNRSPAAQPALAAVPPPATGDPVALTGATYTEAAIAANPKPAGPSNTDIVKPSGSMNPAVVASTPLPGSTSVVMPPPKAAETPPPPVVASAPKTEPLPGLTFASSPTEPLPGLAPAPKPAPSASPPTQVISAPSPVGVAPNMPTITASGDVSAPAVDNKGFPNINVAPPQPTAQLLSPEERAKLIAELNALAGRPAK
jgi:hypothetical protein